MLTQRTLLTLFCALFFLTPLVFYDRNFELFEYNKMMVTYLITVLVTGLWLIRMVYERRVIFQRTPLDLPIAFFLFSQVLSTIFSIDPHTSVWGYYTRSNGGLLSTISYILLFYALVSNFHNQDRAVKLMLFSVLTAGAIVAPWGVLEHFGHSVSCLLITGQFDDACWQQDVHSRVFASLGQPNWLAAYLEMLIFPVFHFLLASRDRLSKILWSCLAVVYYLAFTFAYSRGATLGIIAGMVLFLALSGVALSETSVFESLGKQQLKFFKLSRRKKRELYSTVRVPGAVLVVLGLFLIVNLLFKSALTDFQLLRIDVAPNRPAILSNGGSELDNGGTESGQIRLIVWRGAWQIFTHYPLLGSGVETFAYSYYNFRPMAHNLVSEWDFLYNKAHNEFLNYLSTTGIVGFSAYMSVVFGFIVWSLKQLLAGREKNSNFKLFTLSALSALVSYHIQNFFQFSVVPIALLFFLLPALVFSLASRDQLKFWKLQFPKFKIKLDTFRRPTYRSLFYSACGVVMGLLIFSLVKYWKADTLFAQGFREMENGQFGLAFYDLKDATLLNSGEPYYHSELGLAAAGSAVGLQDQDATTSAQLAAISQKETLTALNTSPANVSYWRTAFQAYYELALMDPKYHYQALNSLGVVEKLAPTDPQPLYQKGLTLDQAHEPGEAIKALKQAVEMKPDYRDALLQLSTEYSEIGQTVLAIETLQTALKHAPQDPQILDDLKRLQSATESASPSP